jgi:hypothetical protein
LLIVFLVPWFWYRLVFLGEPDYGVAALSSADIAGYPQGVLRASGIEVVIEAQSGPIRLVSIDYTRSS